MLAASDLTILAELGVLPDPLADHLAKINSLAARSAEAGPDPVDKPRWDASDAEILAYTAYTARLELFRESVTTASRALTSAESAHRISAVADTCREELRDRLRQRLTELATPLPTIGKYGYDYAVAAAYGTAAEKERARELREASAAWDRLGAYYLDSLRVDRDSVRPGVDGVGGGGSVATFVRPVRTPGVFRPDPRLVCFADIEAAPAGVRTHDGWPSLVDVWQAAPAAGFRVATLDEMTHAVAVAEATEWQRLRGRVASGSAQVHEGMFNLADEIVRGLRVDWPRD